MYVKRFKEKGLGVLKVGEQFTCPRATVSKKNQEDVPNVILPSHSSLHTWRALHHCRASAVETRILQSKRLLRVFEKRKKRSQQNFVAQTIIHPNYDLTRHSTSSVGTFFCPAWHASTSACQTQAAKVRWIGGRARGDNMAGDKFGFLGLAQLTRPRKIQSRL